MYFQKEVVDWLLPNQLFEFCRKVLMRFFEALFLKHDFFAVRATEDFKTQDFATNVF